jgi:TfoX/Sxy family transcriptional regulator of competence genes
LINLYLKALEALYEDYAQKGFYVSTLDGSPFLLGLKATSEPIEIPRSLWGSGSPRCHRARNPVDQEAKQHKQKKINDHRGTSG